jgi:hypothetical protein
MAVGNRRTLHWHSCGGRAVDRYHTTPSFLRFLCEHCCPLTSDAVLRAAQTGQADCLRYLLQQKCPALPADYPAHCESYKWHPALNGALDGNSACIEVLFEHGYTLALNKSQLCTVSDLKCRQLLLEVSGDESCNLFTALPPRPFCPLPVYYF